MKSFAGKSFFLAFEDCLRRGRPKDTDVWLYEGVAWHRSRHSFENESYGFANEVYWMVRNRAAPWSVIVVKEYWWAGRRGSVVRTAHWAKPMSGNRATILAWFKAQDSGTGKPR